MATVGVWTTPGPDTYPGDTTAEVAPTYLQATSTVTRRVIGLTLPDLYRDADAADPGEPLARYVSLITDQLAEVEAIADQVDVRAPSEGGTGGTSALGDPATADPAWLPWLAQLVGVDVRGMAVDDQRTAISLADGSRYVGTLAHIADAARSALVPDARWDGYVRVTRDPDNPWLIHVNTIPAETPSIDAVLNAITVAAKPAGARIDVASYAVSWDTLESRYSTWDAIDAAGSWDTVEATLA